MSRKILLNGKIYIDSQTMVDNLLIEDTLVTAHNVNLADYPDVQRYDLNGNVVYPGFNDSHTHILEAGFIMSIGINLSGAHGVTEICTRMQQKLSNNYTKKVAIGLGFTLENNDGWSLADLAKFDAATGSIPVMAYDSYGHNAILNTAAMELLKIDNSFKAPLGGYVVKENEQLTGMFRESAMSYPGTHFIDEFGIEEIKSDAKQAIDQWAKHGYTSVVDLMCGAGFSVQKSEVFYQLEKEGLLNLRVNYCYVITNANELDDVATYIGRDTDLVRFYGAKLFIDGSMGAGEAFTSFPHQDNSLNYGLNSVCIDDKLGAEYNIHNIVLKAEKLGINMHYHTQGDAAINAVLNALEQVASTGAVRCIHVLAHCSFLTEEHLIRIKKFNGLVRLTMQPVFWEIYTATDTYYGFEKMCKSLPIKEAIDHGLIVGISTDFSVTPPNKVAGMYILKTCVTGGGKFNYTPLTTQDFLQGITLHSGMVTGKNDVGSLHVNQKADMVVCDKDFIPLSAAEITTAPPRILKTILSGRVVEL